MDGTGGELLIGKTHLIGAAVVLIDDEHAGRRVDAPVDHVLEFVVLDGAGGVAALVVPHVAAAEFRVPHVIEDVRMSRVREHHDLTGGLYRRDDILVLPGDVQDLQRAEVQLRVLREIAEPLQDQFVVEVQFFHENAPFKGLLVLL